MNVETPTRKKRLSKGSQVRVIWPAFRAGETGDVIALTVEADTPPVATVRLRSGQKFNYGCDLLEWIGAAESAV